ncbi:MAG: class I SAM-dependent methyltransferase [Bacteroidia bacterium]|nr:class I SAM-dependent methyltransferase [Bacteroidia bacterium]
MKSLLLPFYRAKIAASILSPQYKQLLRWIVHSKETTNFTYHLTDLSREYLANFISLIFATPFSEVIRYFEEIEQDQEFQNHIATYTNQSEFRYKSDTEVRLGRRIAWFAIIRIMKPKIVIETGIDKGLGSCLIANALIRNQREGYTGHYYGTDINPKAGFLFQKPYSSVGEILYGDSIESLRKLSEPVDILISDSDHSETYELNEYEVIFPKMNREGVIIGDNSFQSPSLLRFCQKHGLRFYYFQEKTKDHWYPGEGLGIGLMPLFQTVLAKKTES